MPAFGQIVGTREFAKLSTCQWVPSTPPLVNHIFIKPRVTQWGGGVLFKNGASFLPGQVQLLFFSKGPFLIRLHLVVFGQALKNRSLQLEFTWKERGLVASANQDPLKIPSKVNSWENWPDIWIVFLAHSLGIGRSHWRLDCTALSANCWLKLCSPGPWIREKKRLNNFASRNHIHLSTERI